MTSAFFSSGSVYLLQQSTTPLKNISKCRKPGWRFMCLYVFPSSKSLFTHSYEETLCYDVLFDISTLAKIHQTFVKTIAKSFTLHTVSTRPISGSHANSFSVTQNKGPWLICIPRCLVHYFTCSSAPSSLTHQRVKVRDHLQQSEQMPSAGLVQLQHQCCQFTDVLVDGLWLPWIHRWQHP